MTARSIIYGPKSLYNILIYIAYKIIIEDKQRHIPLCKDWEISFLTSDFKKWPLELPTLYRGMELKYEFEKGFDSRSGSDLLS